MSKITYRGVEFEREELELLLSNFDSRDTPQRELEKLQEKHFTPTYFLEYFHQCVAGDPIDMRNDDEYEGLGIYLGTEDVFTIVKDSNACYVLTTHEIVNLVAKTLDTPVPAC